MMGYQVEDMISEDFDEVYALWKSSKGINLSTIDNRVNIERLLERNPGLSFVVRDAGQVIGAVLCSHDGRMGYLTHLAIDKEYRRQGVGRSLVGRCLFGLMRVGIRKCMLLITEDSKEAKAFWESIGLPARIELVMMSPGKKLIPEGENLNGRS